MDVGRRDNDVQGAVRLSVLGLVSEKGVNRKSRQQEDVHERKADQGDPAGLRNSASGCPHHQPEEPEVAGPDPQAASEGSGELVPLYQ